MKAIVEPDHVRAWAIGAEGERVTGRDLAKLPDGFRVLHDLRILGSRANVDHVVIGPTGVLVIESKRMRGKLQVRGNEVYVAGRRRRMVEEVRSEVAAVEGVLQAAGIPVQVRAVLYLQEADPPWFLATGWHSDRVQRPEAAEAAHVRLGGADANRRGPRGRGTVEPARAPDNSEHARRGAGVESRE